LKEPVSHMPETTYFYYLVPLLLIWMLYFGLNARRQRRSIQLRDAATRAGLTQPASLHPVVDVTRCIGCRSCMSACPEEQVLGLIHGKAELVNPTHCIGHGACKAACPMDAIKLVFGTVQRGVDIPMLTPEFETNVPGMFIAGELGGMGLIRNAVEQGRQAIRSIAGYSSRVPGPKLDVAIIGAGPAGLSASLAAMESRLRFVTLEQDSLGGTVSRFPRGKVVMTAPVTLPLYGRVSFSEVSREELLGFWETVVRNTGLLINCNERVESISQTRNGFDIQSTRASYQTKSVLLAIGRRGTPRKLGVPGEEFGKVAYHLVDPEQYRNQKVLVVGGGDSALEAAISIAELHDTEVILSYRGNAFSRVKEKNRLQVSSLQESGALEVLMNSNVREIHGDRVEIDRQGSLLVLPNDAVIICAGGILPSSFLKEIGIQVDTKYGTE